MPCKLPSPSRRSSSPRPKRPGEEQGHGPPRRSAKEAGISAVDWIDERTSLSGAAAG